MARWPSGPNTAPSRVFTEPTETPHFCAAALARAVRAVAAAVLTGFQREKCEVEPPVSWFQTSSGRASSR